MKPAADYYDEFSNSYNRGRERGYHAFIDDAEAGAVIPRARGKIVLEAGCGTGLIMERLRGAAGNLVGADLSHGMLKSARESGFRVVRADLRALPFKDGCFDVVYSFKVLAHVEDVGRALGEMARVTRPAGFIIAEFYNRSSLRYLARRLRGARVISADTTDRDVYTRYDRWPDIIGMLPPSCRLEEVRGIRIWTPFPFLLRLPLIGRALATLERISSRGPLKRFAGFVLLTFKRLP